MYGMKIQLGYTPTCDDAYMLYGLLEGKVDCRDLQIESVEANLPTLNDYASRGQLQATMISAAAYAFAFERYSLLPSGSSFAIGGGPVVVTRNSNDGGDLAGLCVAIPGATTTACTMLQIYNPALRTRILPLDKLLPAVEMGLVDCALVIHEEFVTYSQHGLHVALDLGKWWNEIHQSPMPISCCIVRDDLPLEQKNQLSEAIRQSVLYARQHHCEAMDYAMNYATGITRTQVQKFVRQYVNDLSADMGQQGADALQTFFTQAVELQILPDPQPLKILQPQPTETENIIDVCKKV
ncbi:MAG: hypothetical protein KAR11_00095 [Phycisphaerae bacterium]|nr:hypothetical protein [Phycisphaerae bacterium]